MQNGNKLYNTDLFTWLMLFLIAPMGLYLLWKTHKYTKPLRVALSIVFGLVFILQTVLINERLNLSNRRGSEFARLGTESSPLKNYGQFKKQQNMGNDKNKPDKDKDKHTPSPTVLQTAAPGSPTPGQTTIPASPTPEQTAIPASPTHEPTPSPAAPSPSAAEPSPAVTASTAPELTATPAETIIPQEPTPTAATPVPTVPEPTSSAVTSVIPSPAPTATQGTMSGNEINAVNTGTTINENGVQTTVYKLDENLLRQNLEIISTGAVLKVLVPDNNAAITLMLSGGILKELDTKNMKLSVNAANVNYEFSVKAINIDSLTASLGSNVNTDNVNFRVTISGASQTVLNVIKENAGAGRFELEMPPVDTNIKVIYNNNSVEVKELNSYILRTVRISDDISGKITTAVALNSDGTLRHIPTDVFVVEGKYYAKINSLTNSVYSLIWNPREFNEMGTHWAKAQVNEMYSRKIINGVTEGVFEPDRSITRAEFAAIAVKALGLEPIGSNAFTDVKNTDWFYNYVGTARNYGIILGVGGGEFQPLRSISREEAMAMVQRAAKLAGMNVAVSENEILSALAKFTDYADFSGWAQGAAAFNIREDLIKGSNGLARPKDYITRAETAVIIMRMLQRSDLIDSRVAA